MTATNDKPIRDARAALLELRGIGSSAPGRVQVLCSRIELALQDKAEALHIQQLAAAVMLFKDRRDGRELSASWRQLWEATDALTKHYGITDVAELLDMVEEAKEAA